MSLKSQAVSGVKWTTASTALGGALDFVRVAALAHLLTSTDFGLMSMVLVVITFSEAFVEMGFSSAIIHRQDAVSEKLSSLYWLSLMMGAVVFGLLVLSAPIVASFYKEPRVAALLPFAACHFLIAPIGQQFQAHLQKQLRFDVIARIDIFSNLIGTAASLLCALNGQGVFSILWGALASASSRSLSLVASGRAEWMPTLHFDHRDLKGYLHFGLYQTGERVVNFLSANVDYLLIGRFLGPSVLGVYTLAYQLVVMPLTKINPVLTRVAFPIFSKKQTDNASLCRAYLQMIKLLAVVVFPILAGLAAVAPLFVPVVYGAAWAPAVPLIQILSLLGALKTLGNPSGSIYLAKGRADIGFFWNLFSAAVNTATFWFAVKQGGVAAVAVSWVVLGMFYSVCSQVILWQVIALDWKKYLAELVSPALASLLMAVSVCALGVLLSGLPVGERVSLLALVAAGAAVYGGLILFFEKRYLTDLWKLLGKREEGAA